jgi:SAM-dependent methyltransferase
MGRMTGPSFFSLFKANPVGLFTRAFYKTFIGPIIYGRKGKFDATLYWSDRFRKYGMDMGGSGYEGLTDRENREMKGIAALDLFDICAKEGIDLSRDRILDIGCAGGFYTKLFRDAGSAGYVGMDIVDTLFPTLQAGFPGFEFIKVDLARERIPGRYRMVFMLDVIQSIVTPESLRYSMESIRDCLEEGGIFILAPLFEATRNIHFHVRQWSHDDVVAHFLDFEIREIRPFRDLRMITFRKPISAGNAVEKAS